MYNKERKLSFINAFPQSYTLSYSYLNRFESYESEADTDLCLLPVEVLQKALDNGFGVKISSKTDVISLVKKYCDWCRNQGYEVSDAIYNVNINTDPQYRETMVSSPAHLSTLLDKIFDPISLSTIDILRRCYLWLAYFGVPNDDTAKLRVDDIDLKNKVINYNGVLFEIYKESIPAFKKACEIQEFTYIHPDYNDLIKRNRVNGDLLLRGIKSSAIDTKIFRAEILRKSKSANIKISFKKIQVSGMFYKMYCQEMAGFTPNFLMYVVERDRLSGKNSTDVALKQLARNYKKDYEAWKHAFYNTKNN